METSRNEASDVIRAMAGDHDAFAALANAIIATLEIPGAGSVAFWDDEAWVTSSTGLVEVSPKTNAIVRTLPLAPTMAVVNDADGLWVTSFDADSLIRVRP